MKTIDKMTKEMLNIALEIEGLIRILKDGEASGEVLALLKQKTASLAAMAATISGDSEAPDRDAHFSEMRTEAPEPHPSEAPDRDAHFSEMRTEAREPHFSEMRTEDDILLFTEEEPKEAPKPAPVKSAGLTDLKKYFSLNDRFLYSRELFGGDMKMFDTTLRFLEGIKDFSDIEDYFYSELEWDPEDPNVSSFLDILRSNFPD